MDVARAPYRRAEEAIAQQEEREREALFATSPKGTTLSQILQRLKAGKISARPGGMKVVFDSDVELETRKQFLLVLNEAVEEESLKDPGYTISFSSEDGTFATYEMTYKGGVTRGSGGRALSPEQFEREIHEKW